MRPPAAAAAPVAVPMQHVVQHVPVSVAVLGSPRRPAAAAPSPAATRRPLPRYLLHQVHVGIAALAKLQDGG